MIKLDRKREALAMNLTYAEQRALEIGVTIAGGASVILLDEPTAGMSRTETAHAVELVRGLTTGVPGWGLLGHAAYLLAFAFVGLWLAGRRMGRLLCK